MGFSSYCWPTLQSPAIPQTIGFFPLCSLPLYHVPQISQLQFLVLDFLYYYYNFFFFALNECDAISSQCSSHNVLYKRCGCLIGRDASKC